MKCNQVLLQILGFEKGWLISFDGIFFFLNEWHEDFSKQCVQWNDDMNFKYDKSQLFSFLISARF